MNINNYLQSIKHFLLISFGIIFVSGGLGYYKEMSLFFGITCLFSLAGYLLIKKGRLKIPDNFFIYLVLLIIMFLHAKIINGKMMFLWLFLSGGLIWVVFYNLKDEVSKYFTPLLTFTGYVMGFLFFYFKATGKFPDNDNLFYPSTILINHNHLGDLWAIILVANFYQMTKKTFWYNWLITASGLLFIIVSSSRSAYLALIIGVLYIYLRSKPQKIIKDISLGLIIFSTFFFVYTSLLKSTIFSRPYFLQSVVGLYYKPLGLGMGSFSDVNLYLGNIFGEGKSTLVHNIILEFMSGIGIFSVVFIYWLVRILLPVFSLNKPNLNIKFAAIFLAVLTNLFFDTTYVIPTYLWIWFISLALL